MTEPRDALERYIKRATAVRPEAFSQEPDFVAAVLGRLEGTAWENEEGTATIRFRSTIATSRGPNSAERRTGADFAITLERISGSESVTKAVIGQAKRGNIRDLTAQRVAELIDQCLRMSKHTDSLLIMETPKDAEHLMVRVIHVKDSQVQIGGRIGFSEYLIDRLNACNHGDMREGFVDGVRSSKLPALTLEIEGLDHELNLDPIPPSPSPGPSRNNGPSM